MNIKLTLAFDGTNYHGWQTQKNSITIQETLQNTMELIMNDVTEIQGVSRTDAGVHALSYIANFHTEKPIPVDRIPIALNSLLPNDIRILNAAEVPENFNSRFDCTSKTYIYRICNSQIQFPFERNFSWHFPYPLDIEKMQEAASFLLGTHDFSSFCASGEQRENHIRTINSIEIAQHPSSIVGDDGNRPAGGLPSAPTNYTTISINADGFLYNMIRIIIGTLTKVESSSEIKKILSSKDRTLAGPTAPPHGLFLKEIFY